MSFAALRAVLDLLPGAGPFLAPAEGAVAYGAYFLGQVGFAVHTCAALCRKVVLKGVNKEGEVQKNEDDALYCRTLIPR